MKLCLVGPGYKPIPPVGWGAVESIVWDYYTYLKERNVDVTVINEPDLNRVLRTILNDGYTHVHIMYDDHVILVPYLKKNTKVFYTSHYAYLTHPGFKHMQYFYTIFKHVLECPTMHILAISEPIRQVYIRHGYPKEKIQVLHNGARSDLFTYTVDPLKKERSIYLGKVEMRKKQYLYQTIMSIDFVGNYHDSSFDLGHPHYLGEWTKDTLYQEMGHYGNLVLLSDGEADPLVVKEALMCGLGVVLSDCSSSNLATKEFITIIPDHQLNNIDFVEKEIIRNREISLSKRQEIREYGQSIFSWSAILDRYMNIIMKDN
jgi:glycosyltransferase involved in cell wall biosynthesis